MSWCLGYYKSRLPRGHEHAGFEGPMLWLMNQRWAALGRRLDGTSKDKLDDDSDYFVLKDSPLRVVNTVGRDQDGGEAVVNTGHKLTGDAWYIQHPESYSKACICNDDEGIEQNLSKRSELNFPAPVFAEEFHFPDSAGGKKLDFLRMAAGASDVDQLIQKLKTDSAITAHSASASNSSASAVPAAPVQTAKGAAAKKVAT